MKEQNFIVVHYYCRCRLMEGTTAEGLRVVLWKGNIEAQTVSSGPESCRSYRPAHLHLCLSNIQHSLGSMATFLFHRAASLSTPSPRPWTLEWELFPMQSCRQQGRACRQPSRRLPGYPRCSLAALSSLMVSTSSVRRCSTLSVPCGPVHPIRRRK